MVLNAFSFFPPKAATNLAVGMYMMYLRIGQHGRSEKESNEGTQSAFRVLFKWEEKKEASTLPHLEQNKLTVSSHGSSQVEERLNSNPKKNRERRQ